MRQAPTPLEIMRFGLRHIADRAHDAAMTASVRPIGTAAVSVDDLIQELADIGSYADDTLAAARKAALPARRPSMAKRADDGFGTKY
jgi:hypothetical protein